MIQLYILILFLSFTVPSFGDGPVSPFQVPLGPKLSAKILLKATDTPDEKKLEPGSTVALALRITNEGDQESMPGKVFVRFISLNAPSGTRPIFQTESVDLPVIFSKGTVSVNFKVFHHWPQAEEFEKEEWQSGEYQVVEVTNGMENIIGHATIKPK